MNIDHLKKNIIKTYSTENLLKTPNLYNLKTFLELEYPEIFLKKYNHLLKWAFPVHYPFNGINIKNKTILDIGCGIGLDCAIAIDLQAYKTFGIELSYSLVKKGFIHKNFVKIIGDYTNNPFKNNIFDLIILNGSFNLFLNKTSLLTECYKNLKKNGLIVILDLLWIDNESKREMYKNSEFWSWNIGGSLTEKELLKNLHIYNFKKIEINTLEIIKPLKRTKIILQKS